MEEGKNWWNRRERISQSRKLFIGVHFATVVWLTRIQDEGIRIILKGFIEKYNYKKAVYKIRNAPIVL